MFGTGLKSSRCAHWRGECYFEIASSEDVRRIEAKQHVLQVLHIRALLCYVKAVVFAVTELATAQLTSAGKEPITCHKHGKVYNAPLVDTENNFARLLRWHVLPSLRQFHSTTGVHNTETEGGGDCV